MRKKKIFKRVVSLVSIFVVMVVLAVQSFAFDIDFTQFDEVIFCYDVKNPSEVIGFAYSTPFTDLYDYSFDLFACSTYNLDTGEIYFKTIVNDPNDFYFGLWNSTNGYTYPSTVQIINFIDEYNLWSSTISGLNGTRYQRGYNSGYSTGETYGYAVGYSQGETQGYNNGYTVGNREGYDKGYAEGSEVVQQDAYLRGYSDGAKDSNYMKNTLITIFSSPYYILNEVFDFEIFGISISKIIMFVISCLLVGFVIKLIL